MATTDQPATQQKRGGVGEPTWEIAQFYPIQGDWTEDEYLALGANRLAELSDGCLAIPPTPTEFHQLIVAYLYEIIKSYASSQNLGTVLFAPIRVRLWQGKFREPDLVFMLAEHAHNRLNQFWQGADLAVEVVSEDDPDRDWVTKRVEYARAGIDEYWIVDPRDATITVFTLNRQTGAYDTAGRYGRGEQAESVLLAGLKVDVAETFARS